MELWYYDSAIHAIRGSHRPWRATPVAMAREIHDAMPGSELVIIPSAAHLSNVEQPRAFNAALLGFLGRAAR